MGQRFYNPDIRPIDSNGNPYPGGRMYFYDYGTSTPRTVYSSLTTQTAATSLGSVLTADGTGLFQECYLADGSYRVVLKTSTGVEVSVKDIAVSSTSLGVGDVGTTNLADGSVTTIKLASQAVTAAKIQDSTITATQLASNAVTTVKITDLNVTTGKINDLAVTTGKLANSTGAADGVTTGKIATGAVTATKIADGIITGGAAGAGVKLAAATITSDNLASNSVTTAKVTDLNITTGKLAANATTVAKLAAEVYKRLPIVGTVAASASTFTGTAPTVPETGASLTVSYAATGTYTITHGLNTTDYSVQITMGNDGSVTSAATVSAKNLNTLVVQTSDSAGLASSRTFNFSIQRNG